MTALRALLWDVDGTLAETEAEGHRVAFNAAFAEHGDRIAAEQAGERGFQFMAGISQEVDTELFKLALVGNVMQGEGFGLGFG